MWFRSEDTLTEEQVRSGLGYVIKDGVASQAKINHLDRTLPILTDTPLLSFLETIQW